MGTVVCVVRVVRWSFAEVVFFSHWEFHEDNVTPIFLFNSSSLSRRSKLLFPPRLPPPPMRAKRSGWWIVEAFSFKQKKSQGHKYNSHTECGYDNARLNRAQETNMLCEFLLFKTTPATLFRPAFSLLRSPPESAQLRTKIISVDSLTRSPPVRTCALFFHASVVATQQYAANRTFQFVSLTLAWPSKCKEKVS